MESLRGPAFSNWLIKGHLLQGPHPASGVSGADSMVRNLHALLEAGVTTFVCLQDEMPVTGGASAGVGAAAGTRYGAPSALVRSAYGSGNVVTAKPYIDQARIVAQTAGMPQVGAGHELSFIHVPIRDADGSVCSDAVLMRLVTDLVAHIKAGEVVYLQCSDGNGRSGTVGAALVGAVYGMSSSEALDAVQRSRGYRAGATGQSPETHEQKMQVHRVLGSGSFREAAVSAPPRLSASDVGAAASSTAEAASVLAHVRTLLQRRGSAALCLFRGFLLSRCDAGKDDFISRAALTDALGEAGLYLTAAETNAVLRWVDPDDTGYARAHDLADGVRGTMPPPRRALVHAVFRKLDPHGIRQVSLDDIAACFTAAGHPDVRSGRRSEEEVQAEFERTFNVAGRDRTVTLEEFEGYYADVSAASPDDNAFKMAMWGVWGLDGSELAPADKSAGLRSAQHRDGVDIVPLGRSLPHGQAAAEDGDDQVAGYGGWAPSGVDEAAEELRKSLLSHGGDFGVARACSALRDLGARNGDDRVDLSDVRAALRGGGAPMSPRDEVSLRCLFDNCVAAGYGSSSSSSASSSSGVGGQPGRGVTAAVGAVEEALCGPLSSSRQRLFAAAFAALDRRWRGDGAVPARQLAGMFHAERHPAVAAGRRREDAVMRDFLESLGTGGPGGDGLVRLPYFERVCRGIAAAFPADGSDDASLSLLLWGCFDLSASKPAAGSTVHRPAAAVDHRFDSGVAARADSGEAGFLDRLDALSSGFKGTSTAPRTGHRQHFVSHPAKHTTAHVVGSGVEQQARAAAAGGDQARLLSPFATRAGYGLGDASAAASKELATGTRGVVGHPRDRRTAHAATVLDTDQRQPSSPSAAATAALGGSSAHAAAPDAKESEQEAAERRMALARDEPSLTYARGGDRGRRHNIAASSALRADHAASLIAQPPDEADRLRAAYTTPTKPAGGHRSQHAAAAAAAAAPSRAVERARQLLRGRGVRGVFALLRWLGIGLVDDASLTRLPASRRVPSAAFARRLREHGLGLSEQEAVEVARHCVPEDSSSSSDDVELALAMEVLCPPLSVQRQRLVAHAHAALLATVGKPSDPVTGAPASLPIGECRAAYNAASHPQVRAARRAEADALREFFESFYPDAADSANVSLEAFARYYQAASAGMPSESDGGDAHFSSLLWAVWDLQSAPPAAAAAAASSASLMAASPQALPAAGRASAPPLADHLAGSGAIPSPSSHAAHGRQQQQHPFHSQPTRRGAAAPRYDAAALPSAGGPSSGASGWGVETAGWSPAVNVAERAAEQKARLMAQKRALVTADPASRAGLRGWGVETAGWTAAVNVAAGSADSWTGAGGNPGSPGSVATASAGGPDAVCARLRATLSRRGPHVYLELARHLRAAGGSPAGPLPPLTPAQLQRALGAASVGISASEAAVAQQGFPNGGRIDTPAFVAAVAGDLAPGRRELVERAWETVVAGAGGQAAEQSITVADAAMAYCADSLSEVRSGRMSEAAALKAFVAPLLELGGPGATPEGVRLTHNDWLQHFALVSAGMPDDSAFRLMMWETFGFGR